MFYFAYKMFEERKREGESVEKISGSCFVGVICNNTNFCDKIYVFYDIIISFVISIFENNKKIHSYNFYKQNFIFLTLLYTMYVYTNLLHFVSCKARNTTFHKT